jgi:hypothetical protein
MNVFRFALVCAVFLVSSTAAVADWDPGDPFKMHYPQLPNVTPLGLDVLAGPRVIPPPTPSDEAIYYEKFLADDFLCTFSGPITDIHIWGSYNQDLFLGGVHPSNALFSLVIYDDVPVSATNPYSHPGNPLWSAYRKPTQARLYTHAQEGFFDPNVPAGQNPIIGTDTQIWQFNVLFDPADAFRQEEGKIYWLGVHASADLNGDGAVGIPDLALYQQYFPGLFGWKTSGSPHFNDDAVFTDVFTVGLNPHTVPTGPWRELRDPRSGESLDLAFVITGIPEPSSVVLMFLGVAGALVFIRRR